MPDPETARQRGERPDAREALLQQLRYLIVEADALEPLLASLPAEALKAPRPDAPSILEAFSELASRDREVHLPAVADHGSGADDAESHAGHDLSAVLNDLRSARARLVTAFEQIPPAGWGSPEPAADDDGSESVAQRALNIVQHDTAILRGAGEWLRGALFSSRQPGVGG